jgi:integrase/recombinase XerC
MPDSTWGSLFADYLQFERRYSLLTVEAYSHDLASFEAYLASQGITSPLEANHHDVRGWVYTLAEEKLAARSINRKVATLRTFYKFAMRRGALTHSPVQAIRNQKTPARVPAFLPETSIDALSNPPLSQEAASPFAHARDALALELLYGTGIRLAEALSLTFGALDTDRGVLTVTGKRNKTRQIPLHGGLLKALKAYLEIYSETFGGPKFSSPLLVTDKGEPAYPMLLQRLTRRSLAGIPNLEKTSPHVLRHTFATHLLDAGAELVAIKNLLGHASLAATQVYTHTSAEKLKAAFKAAHPKGHSD